MVYGKENKIEKYISEGEYFYIKANANINNSNNNIIELKKSGKNRYSVFAKSEGKSVLTYKHDHIKYKYIIHVYNKSYTMDEYGFLDYVGSHKCEKIIFTTKSATKSAKDISDMSDKSVVVWNDKDTIFISSQKKNQKILINDGSFLFARLDNVKYIDVSNLDVSNVRYMNGMFYKCSNLVRIKGLETWNTSNVTLMNSMFSTGDNYAGNGKLKYLDVSKFNTAKVKDMSDMFYGCGELKNLDVSGWDVSNVKSFDHMFTDNFKLQYLDVSNWNTKSCLDFNAMFNDCHSLKNLDVSKWDVSNAIYLSQLFERCTSIVSLDLSKWNTEKCIGFSEMFNGCTNLEILNISSFDTKSVPNNEALDGEKEYFRCSSGMEYVFRDCVNLKTVYVGHKWNVNNKITTGIFDNSNPEIIII